MLMFNTVVVHLAVITVWMYGVKPGSATLQDFNQAGHQQVMHFFTNLVRNVKIPDQHGQSGGAAYTIKNIHTTRFNMPNNSLSPLSDSRFLWSSSDAAVSFHANWLVKKSWWFSTSGSGDIFATHLNISTTLTLGTDSEGRPSITTSTGCSSSVGDVHVELRGHIYFTSILNIFERKSEKKMKKLIPEKLCEVISRQLNLPATLFSD